MPTIAEPLWREKQERVALAIKDFVEAIPRSIDDSPDVLAARLFGYGLRGQDLALELREASQRKFDRQKCPATKQTCRAIKYRGTCRCPWEHGYD